MDTQSFIQKVAAGAASEAKDTLADLLSNRAFEALDMKKQEIATTLYNNGEDIEAQDSEIEDEELLTQEEFDELSEEDQELYLEALEELDEASLMQMVKSAKANVKTKKELHPQYSQPKYGAEMLKKDKEAGKVAYVKRPVQQEEVEQLDEIGDTPAGKKALGSYVKKRVKQLPAIEVNYQMAPDEGGPFGAKRIKKFKTKVNKGIGRAVDRLSK